MKKKLLSLLLLVSLIATMVIVPTTVSAANPWKVLKTFDFSTSADVAGVDRVGQIPGFVAGGVANNSVPFYNIGYDSETQSFVNLASETGLCRFDMTLGTSYSAPDVLRYSFDVKLDNDSNYYIQLFGWTMLYTGSCRFTDFGGEEIRRGEWQRYNVELIPSADGKHQMKCWRGDEEYYKSAKHVTEVGVPGDARYNYITGIRVEELVAGTENVYFDNFKFEKFMFLPEVKGVSFIDNLGYEITDFAVVTPAVSAVKVHFENVDSIDEIIENFWIFNEDLEEEVELGDNPTFENGVFTVTLPNGLQGGCNYSITVDSALTNANGESGDPVYITFKTEQADIQAELKALSNQTYASQKWKTVKTFDFSTSADVTPVARVNDYIPGFAQLSANGLGNPLNYISYDSETQALVKYGSDTNAGRFDITLGYIYYGPDSWKFSFDVKLDEIADYAVYLGGYDQVYTGDCRLSAFGGEALKRGEWQRYNIEIIPISTGWHQMKCWRGDEEDYKNAVLVTGIRQTGRPAAYNYVTWIRVNEITGAVGTANVYFDNFEFSRKRILLATDFASPESYATNTSMSWEYAQPAFHTVNGTVGNDQRLTVDASEGDKVVLRAWLDNRIAQASETQLPVKFSFDLMSDAENTMDLLLEVGAETHDFSQPFKVNSDEYVGGEAFVAGEWQKYNFIVYPNADATQQYFVAWRGDSSNFADAKTVYYTMGNNRTTVSNFMLLNGSPTEEGVTYQIDNVVAEIFHNDGYEIVDPIITGVKATIDNSAAQSGNYWLIVAGYDSDRLDEVELKPLTLESNNKLLTDTLDVPENMKNCKNIKAFLWDSTTLEPLTDFIEVR